MRAALLALALLPLAPAAPSAPFAAAPGVGVSRVFASLQKTRDRLVSCIIVFEIPPPGYLPVPEVFCAQVCARVAPCGRAPVILGAACARLTRVACCCFRPCWAGAEADRSSLEAIQQADGDGRDLAAARATWAAWGVMSPARLREIEASAHRQVLQERRAVPEHIISSLPSFSAVEGAGAAPGGGGGGGGGAATAGKAPWAPFLAGLRGAGPATVALGQLSERSCSVCLEAYEPGERLVQMPCQHFFHKACIERWLRQAKSCPLCKWHDWLGKTGPNGSRSVST